MITTTIEQDAILSCYNNDKDFSISFDNKSFNSWKYKNFSKENLMNNYSIEEIEDLYYEQFSDLDMYKL